MSLEAPLDPALEGLEPVELWRQFDAIRRIPRPSLHEAALRSHLQELAAAQSWESATDEIGNLIIRVAGRGRGVNSTPLAIQGHLDMVCEKRPEVAHDFFRDPISLRRDRATFRGRECDVLRANGTTLGADNGIGCAAGLALALTPGIDHPPLELLFTVDEERGMSGALALTPEFLRARRLLNFDAELEGHVYLSCAGGRELRANWALTREDPREDVAMCVRVSHLRGGHSGVDIHEGRGNAIEALVRLLCAPEVDLGGVRLGSITGGGRANAIPREAEALLWCAPAEVQTFAGAIEAAGRELRDHLAEIDPEARVTVTEVPSAQRCAAPGPVSAEATQAMLGALHSLRNGVLAWSSVIPGLVESSNNIGAIATEGDAIALVCMARSSKRGAIEAFQDDSQRALETSSAAVDYHHAFPGWEANVDTTLVQRAKDVYQSLFDRPVKLEAIHAGLECGVLGDRIPGLEMISFGPDIFDAHTPNESVVTDSVLEFWRFVVALVDSLIDE